MIRSQESPERMYGLVKQDISRFPCSWETQRKMFLHTYNPAFTMLLIGYPMFARHGYHNNLWQLTFSETRPERNSDASLT